ncbi:ABC transporter permease [Chryseomicrobium palamuruense]|uniref:ABC transporter permease n=1 Tax=Chryseomicrobium palamuruense TaxID=682973 RepID=A0ABV8UW37_9BACL
MTKVDASIYTIPTNSAVGEVAVNANKRSHIFQKLMQNKTARNSLFFLSLVILVGVLGPLFAPYNPTEPKYDALLQGPSAAHWLGTDSLGRDLLSRLIYGSRVTLIVGLVSVLITTVIGTFIGLVSAYFGGLVDAILMRIMDVLLALPSIIMALAIVAILGPSLTNAIIAIGISSIPSFSRIVRGAALSVKSSGYVEASRALGSSNGWILRNQILPNIMSTLVVFTTLLAGIAILEMAALGFVGLGAQPPTPEWGTMLNEGKQYIYNAWWLITFPGIAIIMVVYALNKLGDALRDIFDPKSSN